AAPVERRLCRSEEPGARTAAVDPGARTDRDRSERSSALPAWPIGARAGHHTIDLAVHAATGRRGTRLTRRCTADGREQGFRPGFGRTPSAGTIHQQRLRIPAATERAPGPGPASGGAVRRVAARV